jgi:hypothetical protein
MTDDSSLMYSVVAKRLVDAIIMELEEENGMPAGNFVAYAEPHSAPIISNSRVSEWSRNGIETGNPASDIKPIKTNKVIAEADSADWTCAVQTVPESGR